MMFSHSGAGGDSPSFAEVGPTRTTTLSTYPIDQGVAVMREFMVYTDGSCLGNNNLKNCVGGYGYLIVEDGCVVFSGGRKCMNTSNNRMELLAVIVALKALGHLITEIQYSKGSSSVTVVTDSQYVATNFEEYLPEWKENGWRKSSGKPVLNQDLWKRLLTLTPEFMSFGFKWVKGHNGDRFNEQVDAIARGHAFS